MCYQLCWRSMMLRDRPSFNETCLQCDKTASFACYHTLLPHTQTHSLTGFTLGLAPLHSLRQKRLSTCVCVCALEEIVSLCLVALITGPIKDQESGNMHTNAGMHSIEQKHTLLWICGKTQMQLVIVGSYEHRLKICSLQTSLMQKYTGQTCFCLQLCCCGYCSTNPANRKTAARVWRPIKPYCLGWASSCYGDPELTRHTHTHTSDTVNALMQADGLLTNAGQLACLHGNTRNPHISRFCH